MATKEWNADNAVPSSAKSPKYRENKALNIATALAGGRPVHEKSDGKILAVAKAMPDVTTAELADATGLSIAAVNWNIRKLKDAGRLRRVGPDRGGNWEVVEEGQP